MSFHKKVNGWMQGAPVPTSLFESPLLLYNVKNHGYLVNLSDKLLDFCGTHLSETPALHEFVPLLYQNVPKSGLPFLDETEMLLQNAQNAAKRDQTNQNDNQDVRRMAAVVSLEMPTKQIEDHSKVRNTVGTVLKYDGSTEIFACDLDFSMEKRAPGLSSYQPELLMFPMLFPDGIGAKPTKKKHERSETLSEYLHYRMFQLFSPFTLYKPYLPLMYAAVRTKETITNTTEVFLSKEVNTIRKRNPGITEQELYKRLIKKSTSSKVEGSPGFFGIKKSQLMAAARIYGMPHFFLTLTADEISELRWPEIDDLDR